MMKGRADVKRLGVAIQASYTFYTTSRGVLTCDEIVNIPLANAIGRQITLNGADLTILPVVEIKMPEENLNVKIVTNEGRVIEPLKKGNFVYSGDIFKNSLYFVLPNGTNSIKGVSIKAGEKKLKVSLEFGIMSPPYSYDSVVFTQLSDILNFLSGEVIKLNNANSALDGRVDALESKTDNLKLVADTPYFRDVNLPKGVGKQSITIEDGMLYFYIGFFYPSSSEQITHHPKITLFDGSYNEEFVLSITTNPGRVIVDLLAGMIYVATSDTGEIKQQFKISASEHGFKTISFDNFDDITNSNLIINIDGRRVV